MLLNEFLKEHGKVEKQEQTIANLNSAIRDQQEQIGALATPLQAVTRACSRAQTSVITQ